VTATVIENTDRATEIQMLSSSLLVARALQQLPTPSVDLTVGDVKERLTFSQVENADVIIASYMDSNPQRARMVLETLGETYVKSSLERQQAQASNAIAFIQSKLPAAQQQLTRSASAIRDFQEKHGIVVPEGSAQSLSEIELEHEQQILAAETHLQELQRLEQVVRQQIRQIGRDPDTVLLSSVLSQDGGYQTLASQLNEIETQMALDRVRFNADSPPVQRLKAKRDSILQQMREQANRLLGESASQLQDIRTVTPLTVGTPVSSAAPVTLSTPTTSTTESTQGSTSASPPADASQSQSQETNLKSIQQTLAEQLLDVQNQIAVQSTQLDSLHQAQTKLKTQFAELPRLQQEYAGLQRQQQSNAAAVNHFMEALQQLRVAAAEKTSPWRVLEPANLPQVPVSPDIQRSVVLGLLASGLLGVGSAVLAEKLNDRVKGLEEAKILTRLPLLGAIPLAEAIGLLTEAEDPSAARENSRSPYWESLRSLALNLRYLGPSQNIRTIAFTSAVPSEGKSTITYTLAATLAELGQRVLLVDADLRKPTLHRVFQLPNTGGLSTAIATDDPWDDLVSPTSVEGLHVLTSGPLPPNPTALLNSEKMRDLLQEWRQAFDYVLVDTPPIVGIADPQSLAPSVDGMVLVVAVEKSTTSAIKRAMELLQIEQSKVLGIVVNMLNQSHEGYYYQYYSSYYYGRALPEAAGATPEAQPSSHSHRHRSSNPLRSLFRRR
jgi:capsular exopolysaccharide synthesis family protein